ncbi:MAG: L-aspartate oxidase [Candidatus Helarchaeota archaeon]
MNSIETDILVIGSGIAGLFFSIKASRFANIIIITKREKEEANTQYAQGGIASVTTSDDSFEDHVRDTLIAGDGLCSRPVVEEVVEKGPEMIEELIGLGVKFSKKPVGKGYDLGIEGGHSKRRVFHAADMTGKEVQTVLLNRIMEKENVRILEYHIAIDLVCQNGKCIGAYVLDIKNKKVINVSAKITVLATGGAGKVYLYTSNPDIATGDGIAMAYRAGATILNMEFFQFHPTCLYHPYAKSFLISEALRGEGAVLKDKNGKEFMINYHKQKSLAPRDIVARAIDNELKKSGDDCVFLDISFKNPDFIKKRFPGIYKKCLNFGIDITKDPIPVVPAAHYSCGGIKATLDGQTDIQNLLAIGEVTCTGLHGANRLASNSLLEGLVSSFKASEKCRLLLRFDIKNQRFACWESGNAVDSNEAVIISQNWDEIRRFMWNYVGIVRTDKRLERAKKRIVMLRDEINEYYWDFIVTSDLIELRNLATVAEIIIDSALLRKESRGIHYNLDHLEKIEPRNTEIRKKRTWV